MIHSHRLPYLDQLRQIGERPDKALNPAHTLLLLAARDHPGISPSRFDHHLKTLADETAAAFSYLQKDQDQTPDGDQQDPDLKRQALKAVLCDNHDYHQDSNRAALDNLDLMRVIDRRKGLSQTLAVLYLHTAQALGWHAHILALASHFVVRIDQGHRRLIFDPADDCRALEAVDLRRLVKSVLGEEAELSADYYNPLSNREVIIRIQNYKKLRQIEQEDYQAALKTVTDLLLIAPDEYRLLLDEGILRARTGDHEKAIEILRRYIDATPDYREKQDALLLIQNIYDSLSE